VNWQIGGASERLKVAFFQSQIILKGNVEPQWIWLIVIR
jgi:hypothetical protein